MATQIDVRTLTPGASGEGWYFNGNTMEIGLDGEVEFVGGEVQFRINSSGTIVNGIFKGGYTHESLMNYSYGTILNGVFSVRTINSGTILGGTFSGKFTNDDGTIKSMIIKDGFFLVNSQNNIEQAVIIDNGVNIDNYTFSKINNIKLQQRLNIRHNNHKQIQDILHIRCLHTQHKIILHKTDMNHLEVVLLWFRQE